MNWRPSFLPSARVAAVLAAAALVAGCSTDLTRTFGLTHDAPDEFTVTTRAPLSMPPDYSLRPPRPGAPRPQEQSERTQAEQALVPQQALGVAAVADSPGQDALVSEAGPAAMRLMVASDSRRIRSVVIPDHSALG
jgi:hypothetical protein